MPTFSHMISPSFLWNQSAECLPLMERNFFSRSSTVFSAVLNSAWSVPTLAMPPRAR